MKGARTILGSAALGAALLFLAVSSWRATPPRTAVAPSVPTVDVAAPSSAESAASTASVERLPVARDVDQLTALRTRFAASSLRGTQPDGEIALDARGALRLDAELVQHFEYYLTLIGEFSNDEIRALLFADVQRDHGESVANAALVAFDRYLGLREEMAATELADDPAARFEQIKALRRRWFGADADAMFGAAEAYDAYTLQRRAIEQDAELDAAARAARLAELDASRSPAERAAQREATATELAAEQTRQFEQLGTDAATRDSERAALWGEDAAQRLADLDRERAAWDQRLANYAASRQRILADPRLSDTARQRELAALLQRSFDANERMRVEALQSVGALKPRG